MSERDTVMKDVVRKALEKLSTVSNISTGLAHPLDEARAKELFVALHERGVPLLRESIQQHAEACGWPIRHSQELGRLAERIGGGASVRIAHPRGWGRAAVEELLPASP